MEHYLAPSGWSSCPRCCWASGTAAAAQGELGTITGTLKDAQGGVMPGVTATAVNLDTNVKTTAITNEAGVYVLPSLVNGRTV